MDTSSSYYEGEEEEGEAAAGVTIEYDRSSSDIIFSAQLTKGDKKLNAVAREDRKSKLTLPLQKLPSVSGPLISTDLSEEERFAVDFLNGDNIQKMLVTKKQCCKRMCLHSIFASNDKKYDLTPTVELVQMCRRQLIGIGIVNDYSMCALLTSHYLLRRI